MTPGSTTLPLPASPDGDYVACFRALAKLEVEIRQDGPRPQLLLRRSMLHIEMGDLQRGLESAQDAVAAAPRDADAHFQEGMVWMALARLRTGAIVLGPAVEAPELRPLPELLGNAYEAVCAASRCRPSDPDAREHLEFLEDVLGNDEDDIADAFLRGVQAVQDG